MKIKRFNESSENIKKFKEELVGEESVTELDLDYPFYSGDVRNDVDTINPGFSEVSSSMDIDEAIKILKNLKDKGADRV